MKWAPIPVAGACPLLLPTGCGDSSGAAGSIATEESRDAQVAVKVSGQGPSETPVYVIDLAAIASGGKSK